MLRIVTSDLYLLLPFMFLGYWSVRIKRGKVQIEQEQNKKDRREQKKEERRQMLVCDVMRELKVVPFPTLDWN